MQQRDAGAPGGASEPAAAELSASAGASERRFLLDGAASRLVVRTRAKGLLAALAHDLEIAASELRGEASVGETAWTAEVRVSVAGLRVAGALRGDRVDPAVLSASDRAEIEHRLRDQVLAGTSEVVATARGASRARGEVTVALASGRTTASFAPSVGEQGASLRVSARVELSLSALGIREVKGPLGAFKIADRIEVVADLTLRPAEPSKAPRVA